MGYITNEGVWLNKAVYDEAERKYYEGLYSNKVGVSSTSSVALELARAREQIGKTLKSGPSNASGDSLSRISKIEEENKMLLGVCAKLESMMVKLQQRVANLESSGMSSVQSASNDCNIKVIEEVQEEDIDLFGSDDDDDEAAEAIRKERLAAYAAKKSKKPALIAKSSVLLDVKPWDDETDMSELEKSVRKISMDGLVWGASKFVPLAYGIKKMSIMCTVEDDKVSIEELSEKIEAIEDFVQSVDIAAFNKV